MVLITIETLIFKHEIPAFKNLQIPKVSKTKKGKHRDVGDIVGCHFPNTKIAVSAGNFGAYNPRAQEWNEALYNMTNQADAFRWSAFFYLKPFVIYQPS